VPLVCFSLPASAGIPLVNLCKGEPLPDAKIVLDQQRRDGNSSAGTPSWALGLTVVYVTHDQQEAMAVSDRIIVMNAGRIEQQGKPRELYEQPATPFLARFMGESCPARGVVRRLDPAHVRVRLGGIEIDIVDSIAAEGEATIAVRPEAITVEPAPGSAGSLAGTIAKASYLGSHMEYSIDTVAGPLFATCPRVERPLGVGTAVALSLAARGVIVVDD
jgi:iron(III) transport system ATP-binding protein